MPIQEMVVQQDQWSLDGSIKTYLEPLSGDAKHCDTLTDCEGIANHSQNKGILLLSTEITTINLSPSMIDDTGDDHYFSEQHNHPALKPHHKTRPPSFDGYVQTGMLPDSKQPSISCQPNAIMKEAVPSDSDLKVDVSCEAREYSSEGPDVLHLTQLHTIAQQTVSHVTNGRLKGTDVILHDADVHRLSSSATKLSDFQGRAGSSELNDDGYITTDHFHICAALTTDFDEEMLYDIDDFGYNFQMSETT